MRIISWNIKGLGNPFKNFSIKEVLRRYKADIIMLQETKKEVIDNKCFQSVWGSRKHDWVSLLPTALAGGMLISWKKELFDLISIKHGFYSLSVKPFLTGFQD